MTIQAPGRAIRYNLFCAEKAQKKMPPSSLAQKQQQ
jgi:hypothetical protein